MFGNKTARVKSPPVKSCLLPVNIHQLFHAGKFVRLLISVFRVSFILYNHCVESTRRQSAQE